MWDTLWQVKQCIGSQTFTKLRRGTINIAFEYTRNGINLEVDEEFDFRDFTEDEYDIDGLDIDGIIKTLDVPYPLTPDEIVELKNALGKIDYTDIKYPCSC